MEKKQDGLLDELFLLGKFVFIVAILTAVLLVVVPKRDRVFEANMMAMPEYKELFGYGELESVFYLADLEAEEKWDALFLYQYLSYQNFYFHNYSVNGWWQMGDVHLEFLQDDKILRNAFRESDCQTLRSMSERLGLKTIVVKNLPANFSCDIPVDARPGRFVVFKPAGVQFEGV